MKIQDEFWRKYKKLLWLLIGIVLTSTACEIQAPVDIPYYEVGEVPEYTGDIYTIVNGNSPNFIEDEITNVAYEYYSELDYLGRCGIAIASIGMDLMPVEQRESISQVTPSGWENMEYDHVSGGYLYNRCHLIGFQLAGENANDKNLITGTRSFNYEGMLPFENIVADYVVETNYHVMYRVIPVYQGDDLVARGVFMEAYSVEDEGEGVCFHVFVHNVEEFIEIDYATGMSRLLIGEEGEVWEELDEELWEGIEEEVDEEVEEVLEEWEEQLLEEDASTHYILNTNTKKFHMSTCSSVEDMSEHNKEEFDGMREDVIKSGYTPCQRCNP
ncbi:MAG: DNA/RNA non-specific endonuclease [Eubacteriales bacterium]